MKSTQTRFNTLKNTKTRVNTLGAPCSQALEDEPAVPAEWPAPPAGSQGLAREARRLADTVASLRSEAR